MPRFAYQVRDASGPASGTLVANDLAEASKMLRKDGKAIVSLQEQTGDESAPAARGGRVRHDDVIFFATQLAVMVDTGVTLADALDAVAQQTDNGALQRVVRDVADRVKGGEEFSAALERHPKVFNRLFCAMMRASEASGMMGQMLQRVSEYMEQERDTRKKIKGALTYPACMLAFCVLVVVALLVFVLPRFETIYEGKGAMLPLPTRMLLGMSRGLLHHWPAIVAGIVGLIVGGVYFFRRPEGRILLDRARLEIPVVGKMYRKAYLARSLRTMATMVASGVSTLDGLAITAQVAGNHFYGKIWTDLAERVKEGATMSDELIHCRLIPRSVVQMIAAGERTGKLSVVMHRVAGFCEDDLKVAVKTMTQLIEPLMIVVMGIIVGGIAMALMLPIFTISRVMAH